MAKDGKQAHEAEVFRAFLEAGRLPIAPESVKNLEPDYPDMQCVDADGKVLLFELGEVLWQNDDADVKTLPHGLAKSDSAADEKEALISAGRIDEAERIQTWGAFHSPVLGSLLQMLDKKCRKRYATNDHPVSLLLYYEREQPNDPFEKLFDIREAIHYLLAHSQFSEVWLYHHAMGHTFKLPDMPDGAPEGLVVRVSLMAFAAPDTQRRVIGHITLGKDHVAMSFDASYTANYGLGIRIKGPPED